MINSVVVCLRLRVKVVYTSDILYKFQWLLQYSNLIIYMIKEI